MPPGVSPRLNSCTAPHLPSREQIAVPVTDPPARRYPDLSYTSALSSDHWQIGVASQILMAPVRNGIAGAHDSWIAVTNGKYLDDKPRFARDGNSIYFLSSRDQHTCIWEQKLDPQTKHPAGPAEVYAHLHHESFDFFRQNRTTFSAAKDKIAVGLPDVHSDLWVKDPAEGGL